MVSELIPGRLYVGDQADATQEPLAEEYGIDYVVTVCPDRNHQTDTLIPIDDGTHDYQEFAYGVRVVLNRLYVGDTVFVHCHAGQSRSVATVICAVADWIDLSYTDACQYVSASHGMAVSRELRRSAKQYCATGLEAHDTGLGSPEASTSG